MELIIEDGSIVANADSYVTRDDYITYAATLGITVADADGADVELRKAAEYIGWHEDNLKGAKVERDQSMAHPRTDLTIEGWYWTSDEIARQVILCQMAFALDINAGEDLWNRSLNPNPAVKKERVEGAVSVEYAVDDSGRKLSKSSKGDALLASLLRRNGLVSIPMVRA